MELFIIRFFILFAFYILGAYATTDITRLLKGSQTPINASDCYCPICGYKIPLSNQFPIISYIKNKGKCSHCHSLIPFSDIFLEIFIFTGCSFISIITSFSWTSYFLCLTFFEVTKAIYILQKGPREDKFLYHLFRSFCNNLLFFLLLAILFGLYRLISTI